MRIVFGKCKVGRGCGSTERGGGCRSLYQPPEAETYTGAVVRLNRNVEYVKNSELLSAAVCTAASLDALLLRVGRLPGVDDKSATTSAPSRPISIGKYEPVATPNSCASLEYGLARTPLRVLLLTSDHVWLTFLDACS